MGELPQSEAVNQAQKLSRMATQASVIVALILITSKTWAYWMTGSISLMGSLLDSILDGITSLVNFFALRYALMPADDDHKFGHGKLESIAALSQAGFMIGSAVVLILNSVDAIFDKREVIDSVIGMAVSVLAIVLTLGLVIFQKYVIRKSQSLIVEADSLHYQGDLLLNLAVIFALVFVDFGVVWMDALMAILIGAYLSYNAWKVGSRAFQDLMDQQLPDVEKQVRSVVLDAPGSHGCHDVRCRQSGPNTFIQFHLEIDENLPLWSAHEIGDRIEQRLKKEYPQADITIHHDPVRVE